MTRRHCVLRHLCFPRSGGLPTHTTCDCARRAPGKTSEAQSTRHGGANTNRASGLLRSLAAGAKSGVLAVTVSVARRSPCVQRPWWPPGIVRGVGGRRGVAGAGAKLVPMRSYAAPVGRRVASRRSRHPWRLPRHRGRPAFSRPPVVGVQISRRRVRSIGCQVGARRGRRCRRPTRCRGVRCGRRPRPPSSPGVRPCELALAPRLPCARRIVLPESDDRLLVVRGLGGDVEASGRLVP